jgi:hypothetical protein
MTRTVKRFRAGPTSKRARYLGAARSLAHLLGRGATNGHAIICRDDGLVNHTNRLAFGPARPLPDVQFRPRERFGRFDPMRASMPSRMRARP